ncbi:helix-turn-helix domain-containing protein [Paenibacillus larvae]|uniref:helix-turn-helix domain-containing protein n=1 Tax=Paenibacillus larvae TaxID=1464 RepID=UPI00288DB8B8|nr:helix-turn-helix domain-containing protein [Paenibacillus larvae]MDT2232883.1 helix-turn-helix domain-containing protein [Paenibacillus larvae]
MELSVKTARVNAGVTQEVAARYLGLSLTGYAKKERGKSKFYVDEILVLSELYGVDYRIFLNLRVIKRHKQMYIVKKK